MKSFNRLIIIALLLTAALFAGVNLLLPRFLPDSGMNEKNCLVEAERVSRTISEGGEPDLSACSFITNVTPCDGTEEFYETKGNACFREINGTVYRLDYQLPSASSTVRIAANIAVAAASAVMLGVLIYMRQKLVLPFDRLSDMPYELSRGNLTVPLKENKSRFFGKFVWGTDMLRESLEKRRARELEFQKDKQTMLLSISHDIKTPLSAIKLYSKALSKGIYTDEAKLAEVYEGIGQRADEIEQYVSRLTSSASDDFLSLEVKEGEMYLSELVDGLKQYYSDKLSELHIPLEIGDYDECMLSCDPDRAAEVLQNVMENAIKYGDGKGISLSFSEEEDCRLITVSNGGCTLREEELIHIFDSFRRGPNAGNKPGSGLGLYICRQLMSKMGGDIFARTENGNMHVTAVFRKA
ncbi:MAG: HAMP domain-containing histidine kinase [Ruminococcus sp.]|nr:HAMP domain-containing histidine kinase [Ruminococcus sp.]